MDNIQQLIKESGSQYTPFYPKTLISAIKNGNGAGLEEILQAFNMYFLSYVGSTKDTRLQVPVELRRQGLYITYVLFDGTTKVEYYDSSDTSDVTWGDDAYWKSGNNMLVGDINISSEGNWVVNNIDTGVKATGENGISPVLRFKDNKFEVSYNNGGTWEVVSDAITAKFRWLATGTNAGRIQMSTDGGGYWEDVSPDFNVDIKIKGYVANVASLPANALQGDIYMVGPTYDPADTEHTNPIYRMYVRNGSSWVDNGVYTSVDAGITQALGSSTTDVPSQKLVTDNTSVYNVSLMEPRTDGSYHTLETAVSTIEPTVRKLGLVILFEISASVWVSYQFVGNSTSTWNTLSNWVKQAHNSTTSILDNMISSASLQEGSVSTTKVQDLAITGDKLESRYKDSIEDYYVRVGISEDSYMPTTPSSNIFYGTGANQGRAWAMTYKNAVKKTVNAIRVKPTYPFSIVKLQILILPDVLSEVDGEVPTMTGPIIVRNHDITNAWNRSIGEVTTICFPDIELQGNKNYAFGIVTPVGSDLGMYASPVATAAANAGLSNVRPRIIKLGEKWVYAANSNSTTLYCVPIKWNTEKKLALNPDYLPLIESKDIAKETITTSNIQNGAVTEDKTIFFDASKNLFNPDDPDVLPGRYVSDTTGLTPVNTAYTASGYIPVEESTWYYLSYKYKIAWYDKDKIFIGGDGELAAYAQQSPVGASYLRCTIVNTSFDSFMVSKGNTKLPYVPFGYSLKDKYLGQGFIPNLPNNICLPKKLYMLEGVQNDIFVEALIKRWRPEMFDVRFSGTATYSRRLQKVASVTAPVDGRTIIASLIDRNYFKVRDQKTSTIVVGKPSVGTGTVCVQIIGDSYTEGSFFLDALITKKYVPGIKMVGLRNTAGLSTQFDEGRGGWTLANYFSVQTGRVVSYAGFWQPTGDYRYWGSTAFWKLANDIRKNPSGGWTSTETYNVGRYTASSLKFDADTGVKLNPVNGDIMYDNSQGTYVVYNGSSWVATTYDAYTWEFNYSKYLQMWGFQAPTIVGILLGLNDFRNMPDPENIDFTVWNQRMETVIASYKEAVPNGKFVIMMPCSTCGILDNLPGDYTIKQNACMWKTRENIINKFDSRESQGIYIVDTAIATSNDYGYLVSTNQGVIKPYSEYTGSEKIFTQTGNPHPYPNYPNMGVSFAAFIQKYRG